MKKKLFGTIAVIAFYNSFFAQEKDTARIEEVVITGQFNPQSIKKSLYKVEVITQEDIQRMAVNNVAEVLNQTLNILINPDQKTGNSKANLMELGSNYTKVLVDNIPLISDTAFGSDLDLTKIALENVERIEIVKGSMGVEFGNNAIAGVINIITKKSSRKKWNINGTIQEETVGKEYDWVDYGKGRHIQTLGISHNISDKWFTSLTFNRNNFQGFWGDKGGKNTFTQDGMRGYYWQPKEQLNPAFMLKFSTPKTQFFYKADYLQEEINLYNSLVELKQLGGGERTFIAKDRNSYTDRMLHHFNILSDVFRKSKLSLDVSYQKQTRKNENFITDIPAVQIISKDAKQTLYESETIYSRGTLNNFINSQKINLQIGYEGDFTKGYAGFDPDATADTNVNEKDVLNGAVFAAAEFNLSESWFLRPGFRMNFSDTFNTKPNFSLVLKNNINDHSEFRAIIGSANRNPTFDELFTYFVDSNHDVRGNEDLKPENSVSGTLFYSIYNKPNSNFKWNVDVSTMFLQVEDQIQLAQTNDIPLQFKYINIDTFETWVNSVSGKISNKNFGLSTGFSILGRSLAFNGYEDEKYQYTNEVNASAYYHLLKTNTTFALYYKGRGKSYSIVEDKSLGITQYLLTERKAFSLMDFSVSQKIWKNHFTITAGVRNIFDIGSTIVGGSGGSHNTSAQEMMFYGRSYFGRLNFNF